MKGVNQSMDYFKQLKLKDDPDQLAIEEIINPKIDQSNFDDWIELKRKIGKKKFNRIDKRTRRLAIKKKQLGLR
jgi:hypothetical protein